MIYIPFNEKGDKSNSYFTLFICNFSVPFSSIGLYIDK